MLDILISPSDHSSFFNNYWNTKHKKIESQIHQLFQLSIHKFIDIVNTRSLSFPQLTCLTPHGQADIMSYTKSKSSQLNSAICPDKALSLINQGGTLRIKGLNTLDTNICYIRNQFIDTFAWDVTINGYYSTGGCLGINSHYDIRHIFIVQIEGSKKWKIGNKIPSVPRHDFRPFWDPESFEVLEEITLGVGEILYLPPGLWHTTETTDKSLHLAVGITTPDWSDALKGFVTYLMRKHPLLRTHLPFNVQDNKLIYQENIDKDLLQLVDLMKDEVDSYSWEKFIHDEMHKKP